MAKHTVSVGFRAGFSGKGGELRRSLRSSVERALLVAAQALLADSRPYVPVLTGALLDSGRIEVVQTTPGSDVSRVEVVYGGEAVDYARRQHDEPFNHPSLGFYGAAEYLTRPFRRFAPFYAEIIRIEVQRGLADFGG